MCITGGLVSFWRLRLPSTLGEGSALVADLLLPLQVSSLAALSPQS
jgi:hypothetical protein